MAQHCNVDQNKSGGAHYKILKRMDGRICQVYPPNQQKRKRRPPSSPTTLSGRSRAKRRPLQPNSPRFCWIYTATLNVCNQKRLASYCPLASSLENDGNTDVYGDVKPAPETLGTASRYGHCGLSRAVRTKAEPRRNCEICAKNFRRKVGSKRLVHQGAFMDGQASKQT